MNTEQIVTIVSCFVISIASGLGVFSEKYKDTLLQRISLGGMCLSSLGIAHYVWQFNDCPKPFGIFTTCVAMWSISIIWKYRHGVKK